MLTITKYLFNRVESRQNKLISRTLGKVGVIDPVIYQCLEIRPNHDEFWFSEVLSELGKGTNKGVFVLRPIKKVPTTFRGGVAEPAIVRLIPGTFSVEQREGTLYLYPATANGLLGPNWILDMDVRQYLSKKFTDSTGRCAFNSVIVVLDEKPCDLFKDLQPPQEEPLLDLEDLAEAAAQDNTASPED